MSNKKESESEALSMKSTIVISGVLIGADVGCYLFPPCAAATTAYIAAMNGITAAAGASTTTGLATTSLAKLGVAQCLYTAGATAIATPFTASSAAASVVSAGGIIGSSVVLWMVK